MVALSSAARIFVIPSGVEESQAFLFVGRNELP
jgi:hypothetical protein